MNYATTFREGYAELNETLGKRESRKLAHNTYARREGDAIVVRFHATDIIEYPGDDTVILRAGGWHTVTTARRFADYLPRYWSVSNDRGVWNMFGPFGDQERREYGSGEYAREYSYQPIAAHFRFWDDMRVTDTPRPFLVNYESAPDFPERDSIARELRERITEYVKGYDVETIGELFAPDANGNVSFAGDCFYCLGIVTDYETGKTSENVDHLVSHILESYRMGSVVRNAFRFRRYGNPDVVLLWAVSDTRLSGRGLVDIRDNLTRYLTHALIPHGSTPRVDRETLDYLKREVELVA